MVVSPCTSSNPIPIPLVKLIDLNLSTFVDPNESDIADADLMHETVGCVHYSAPWTCKAALEAEKWAEKAGLRYRLSAMERPTSPPVPKFTPNLGLSASNPKSADVYSFAVCLFGMLQGYFPFRSTDVCSLSLELTKVLRKPRSRRLTLPVNISSLAKDFLETAFQFDSLATIDTLLSHPWLAPVDQLAVEFPVLTRGFDPNPPSLTIPKDVRDDDWYLASLLRSNNYQPTKMRTTMVRSLSAATSAFGSVIKQALDRRTEEEAAMSKRFNAASSEDLSSTTEWTLIADFERMFDDSEQEELRKRRCSKDSGYAASCECEYQGIELAA